jgi:hypothetical protein
MNKTPTMTQKQRDSFESALREALRAANRELQDKRQAAHDTAIQKLAAEFGCDDLVNEVKTLGQNLTSASAALESKGFELHGDNVQLIWNAPELLKTAYETVIEQQTADLAKKRDEIQQALNSAWAISDLPEAKKLVDTFAVVQ